ncbi:MAG: 4Fe-4S cluster-binding domain-containing protein [Candidatus Fournierella pullistercoris]|uniref:4Fe-4S cluster-binding domain-containing protein n=1 Tax=Candidatus Allofournierella pullistercoris TaxID=2838597 RepID=A0A948T208_9FIRM|nr:4Fe-4S cluster-binding domain-containing protein [Candidatus Fournierella pullistercoris]
MQIPHSCTLCPRQCGADRTRQKGACGAANQLRIARAALHHWEEPCISGTRGSGTVFFSGCSLRCCYCQNHPISQQGVGKDIDEHRLAEIFLYLQSQGAHNINLVTASQWLPWVIEALQIARSQGLNLPVVYNTSGYETLETVQRLEGLVDIWLADIKYVSSELSGQYSFAKDYFQVCSQAVQAMIQQVGAPVMDEAGLMKRGVILRHLALPGHLEDSRRVLDFMASLPKDSFLTSLMSQYTPFYKAKELKPLNRRISTWEYRQVVNYAMDLGLTQGFMQQKSSAKEEYTPPFNLEGV